MPLSNLNYNSSDLPPGLRDKFIRLWKFIAIPIVIGFLVSSVKFFLTANQFKKEILNQASKSIQTQTNTSLAPADFEKLFGAGQPAFGVPTAKVKIALFGDFSCPACYLFFPTIRKIMNNYADKIYLVFHDFPGFDFSQSAAEAGRCANAQKKFWPLHDLMFQSQNKLETINIKKYALQAGLNTATFNQCLDSGRFKTAVDNDVILGASLGVTGTPTLFINGYKLEGDISENILRQAIEIILTSQ